MHSLGSYFKPFEDISSNNLNEETARYSWIFYMSCPTI